MKMRCVQMLVAVLLLETLGFGTNDAQSQEFSSFEYNQVSNTVILKWNNSSNALYEMQASTNIISELWEQAGGWTNTLGTNLNNSIQLSTEGYKSGFFRLVARSNSRQYSAFSGMALRANSNLVTGDDSLVEVPYGSMICIWDNSNSVYHCATRGNKYPWHGYLEITNNQSFFYFPSSGEGLLPTEWTHAYVKDWRLISPNDLPVTGNVLIEWSPIDSYSTPSNPIPNIPIVNITIKNSEWSVITNWTSQIPDVSSFIWGSQNNSNGYYIIEVDVAGLETIQKQVYLYN
ncbi:hypothetical protein P4C99_04205 [Pontiellaceae bacterium B1224]|nr:hypothetical protein [Pontiellaceae bacterium B1224]